MMIIALSAVLLAASTASEPETSQIRQKITIKSRGSSGPPVQLPQPEVSPAVIDEVVRTLDIYKKPVEIKTPEVKVQARFSRLEQPFPEPPYLSLSPRSIASPYESWVFEVLDGGQVLWKTEGQGPLKERIEWSGSDQEGRQAARVGRPYHFRFTGKRAEGSFVVASEPIALKSLAVKQYLGDIHLEAANSLLFEPDKPALRSEAEPFLEAMGRALRRTDLRQKACKMILYDEQPQSRFAKSRAALLKRYFSRFLLINANRIELEIQPIGERGEITVAVVSADRGPTIKMEP
ncbi:MAG: hypothetical protein HY549_04300 [Elusimicrobia bacterium]|nr:hypothetical protein [Elusimicrobiota bacterium]